MTSPAVCIPLLTNNPVGWLAFGAAGYLTYRIGKKIGLKSNENPDRVNLADRAVKGAMKTAYKARAKIGKSLSKTREKYSGMWDEVQSESRGES